MSLRSLVPLLFPVGKAVTRMLTSPEILRVDLHDIELPPHARAHCTMPNPSPPTHPAQPPPLVAVEARDSIGKKAQRWAHRRPGSTYGPETEWLCQIQVRGRHFQAAIRYTPLSGTSLAEENTTWESDTIPECFRPGLRERHRSRSQACSDGRR